MKSKVLLLRQIELWEYGTKVKKMYLFDKRKNGLLDNYLMERVTLAKGVLAKPKTEIQGCKQSANKVLAKSSILMLNFNPSRLSITSSLPILSRFIVEPSHLTTRSNHIAFPHPHTSLTRCIGRASRLS